MAQNNGNGGINVGRHDYENMSRDELVAIIGRDVEPGTSYSDLIIMAIEADEARLA